MKIEYTRTPKTLEIKGVKVEVPKRTVRLQQELNCILQKHNNHETTPEVSVLNSFRLLVGENAFTNIFPVTDDIDLDELLYYNDELLKLYLANLPV